MKTLLAFLGILVCTTGCHSKPSGAEYFPILASGKGLHFTMEILAPSTGVQRGELVVRSEPRQQINGIWYLKTAAIMSGIPGIEPEISFARFGDVGIYALDGANIDFGEYLATPLPIEVGKTWTVKRANSTTTYVAAGIEDLETVSRRYERCLKISMTGHNKNGEFSGYSFRAPGIGEVKGVFKGNGTTVEYVLREK